MSNFTFTHNEKTYEFEHDFTEVRKPGFIRKHRYEGLDELTFSVLEEVAGDEVLAVLDDMHREDWTRVVNEMWTEIREGGTPGE